MKKTAALLLLINIIFFCGCSGINKAELNERLIIESVGIDYSDGKYIVSIEGLNSMTAGTDDEKSLTECYEFKSSSIGNAMNSISIKTGLSPLFSQTRVLVIGIDTAKTKLSEVLDFFRREYTTRTDILVCVSDNYAKNIISADYGAEVSAGKLIEQIIKSYRYTSSSVYIPLYKLLNSAANETDASLCPLITLKENAAAGKKEPEISGTAVFGKDGRYTVLDAKQTFAYMLLTDRAEKGSITLEDPKGNFTLQLIKSRASTKLDISGDEIISSSEIRLSFDISEFQTEDFSPLREDDIKRISDETARYIAAEAADVLNSVYAENGFDIFGTGRRVLLEDRNYYKENFGKFREKTSFRIKIKTEIRRTGKITVKK